MYNCEICQFNFAHKAGLACHQQAHRSGIVLPCKKCGGSFFGTTVYKAHACVRERAEKRALLNESKTLAENNCQFHFLAQPNTKTYQAEISPVRAVPAIIIAEKTFDDYLCEAVFNV